MASLSDVTISDADWSDLYALLGTPTTSTIQFVNKGSIPLLYQEAVAKPNINSTQGIPILPDGVRHSVLPKSGEKVFVRAMNTSDSTVDSTIVAALLG